MITSILSTGPSASENISPFLLHGLSMTKAVLGFAPSKSGVPVKGWGVKPGTIDGSESYEILKYEVAYRDCKIFLNHLKIE